MFNQYPYINENDLNLDYMLKSIKKLKEIVDEFVTLNTITFADPITWNISTQYARNVVVIDVSGNAYLSKVAVPAGVQLNNADYWLEIFNFTEYTRTANQNLTVNVETNTTRATATYAVDDWLLWDDVLYKVIAPIAIDDTFITTPDAGANIDHFTVEDFIKAFILYATNLINQYKNDIDASELAYRQQLATDIAATTQSMQAQLNLAISGATVDSEVINARLGADGVTYATLGIAIRTQIENIQHTIDNNLYLGDFAADELQKIFKNGRYGVDANGLIEFPTQSNRICIDKCITFPVDALVTPASGYQFNIQTYNTRFVKGKLASSVHLNDYQGYNNRPLYIPANTLFTIVFLKIDNSDLSPSDFNSSTCTFKFIDSKAVENRIVSSENEEIIINNIALLTRMSDFGTDNNTIKFTPSATRCSMQKAITFPKRTIFYTKSNDYRVTVRSFTSEIIDGANTSVIIRQDVATSSKYVSIPANTPVALTFRRNDNADITQSIITDSNFGIMLIDDVDTRHNLLQDPALNIIDGYHYSPQYGGLFPASGVAALVPIEIKKDVQYFFRDIYGYFSSVLYDNGTYSAITSSASEKRGGHFRAVDNGVLLITISTNSNYDFDYCLESGHDGKIYYLSNTGEKEFSTIREAVAYGTYFKNSRIYAIKSSFDLIAEFGSDLDLIDAGNPGLVLQNGIELIFDNASIIRCFYNGSAYNVKHYFSPFNAGKGGFKLENVNLRCGNVRYAVHDERGSTTDAYHNIYKNCKFYLNNESNPDGYMSCIGGGLGSDGYIEVLGCVFESNGASNQDIVSWHNNVADNSESKIVIKDNYFVGTTGIRFSWYGVSQAISKMYASNNSFGRSIITRAETADSTTVNTEIISWNNEVRT